MMELYEILVPCKFEDTQKPVSTRHHQEWDKMIRRLAGGLTVFKPTIKGEWVNEEDGQIYNDRTIPVRIACSRSIIMRICEFTKHHYRQKAVFAYRISDDVICV